MGRAVRVGSDTCRRLAWCALFALVAGGPYLLGTHGQASVTAASGTYGFAVFGLLAGIWLTCYPGVAASVRQPAIWKTCLCVGLTARIALLTFGLFELVFSLASEVAPLHAALYSDDDTARVWALKALAVAEAVGSCEKPLTFVTASLCGVTSACFVGMGCAERVAAHRRVAAGFAALGMFLVGFLRATAWGFLLPSAFGAVLLLGVLFEWAWCMARRSGLRASMAAFCMGELAFRLTSRFGMQVMPVSDSLSCAAAVVCAACLCACVVVFSRGANAPGQVVPCVRDDGASVSEPVVEAMHAGLLEAWERDRLEGTGLTGRELEVLAVSLVEADSAAVARRLGLQASTVRTYRGRICKKLGFESFDKLVAGRAAGIGLFAPPEGDGPVGEERTAPVPTTRRLAVSVALRFVGCASSLILLLMPYGTLPAFWDATWVMALAVACGVMAAFFVGALRCYAGSRGGGALHVWVVPVLFAACAALVVYLRLGMELGGWGFPEPMQVALFFAVAGLVCFGVVELHFCLGALRSTPEAFAVAAAAVAAVAALAVLPTCLRYSLTVAMSLASVVGLALGAGRTGRATGSDGCAEAQAHPLVALSWLVAAFLWEECWRGVGYASLQDVGLPFLAVLVVADAIALVRRGGRVRTACIVTLACSACICVPRDLGFGLFVAFALLEVQLLCGQERTAHPQAAHGKAVGPNVPVGSSAPILTPALLALPCVATGCCLGMYVTNSWGTYALLHSASILPADLDWTSLCCFAAFIAVAACRVVLVPFVAVPIELDVSKARLEGYLVGKGLTSQEVQVCVALVHGESVAQVAQDLSYSLSATGAMKRAAFSKLGVATRRQLMVALWGELDPKRVNENN